MKVPTWLAVHMKLPSGLIGPESPGGHPKSPTCGHPKLPHLG
jgi:hypothetical protein